MYAFTNYAFNKQTDVADKSLAKSIMHLDHEFIQAQKETHKERLVKLKLLLNEIEEDNWKYENVDKLIGI